MMALTSAGGHLDSDSPHDAARNGGMNAQGRREDSGIRYDSYD